MGSLAWQRNDQKGTASVVAGMVVVAGQTAEARSALRRQRWMLAVRGTAPTAGTARENEWMSLLQESAASVYGGVVE